MSFIIHYSFDEEFYSGEQDGNCCEILAFPRNDSRRASTSHSKPMLHLKLKTVSAQPVLIEGPDVARLYLSVL